MILAGLAQVYAGVGGAGGEVKVMTPDSTIALSEASAWMIGNCHIFVNLA